MKRQLTWKPDSKTKTSGRYCKQIEGRVYYFGRAKKKDDQKAYDRALDAYHQFLADQQEQQKQQDRFVSLVTRQAQGDPTVQTRMLDDPKTILWLWQQSEEKRKRKEAKSKTDKPICEQIDLFIEFQERRHRAGEISESRLQNANRHVTAFGEHVNGHRWSRSDDGSNEQILQSFRAILDDAVADGSMAESYQSDRVEVLKRFIKWSYEERHLSRLPSNLDRVCKRKQRTVNPKPFTVEEVRRIWKAADDELRCYMALALNAGYYAADEATIEAQHLQGDYLIKPRQKTKRHGVVMKHLLWNVTRELIEQRRVDGDGPILRSPKGGLIVKGRKDRCQQALKPVLEKLGIEGKSFSSFRDTGASIIAAINPGVREQYLGHRDRTQAAFYVGDAEVVMGKAAVKSPLDEAIRKLEITLDLNDLSN